MHRNCEKRGRMRKGRNGDGGGLQANVTLGTRSSKVLMVEVVCYLHLYFLNSMANWVVSPSCNLKLQFSNHVLHPHGILDFFGWTKKSNLIRVTLRIVYKIRLPVIGQNLKISYGTDGQWLDLLS